jgi:hypothetical protein
MAMQRWLMFTGALVLAACSEDAGAELTVRAWGEEYIEEGIPADEFNDGWAVKYDRFLINLGTVEVGQAGAAPALEEPQFQVFDLARASKGEGQLVVAGEVPAGSYSNTQYKIYPADDDSIAGNASDADMKMMQGSKYSVFVSGTATKGGVDKSFAWGFKTSTSYEGCESKGEIAEGRPGAVQVTVHGDHLFYDDLFSEEPMLLFGLIAQADDDGDANGEVSQAELEAVDIRPLANYQVGSTDIVDLWHFIEHQTTTLGHIDGEGHCETIREG